jgi:hypothetical protein
MSRFHDRDGRFHVQVLDQRACDRVGQILLKDQSMREGVAQLRDSAEPRHAPVRQEGDVRDTLRGHQVMRTNEHQRDMGGDDRTGVIDRKTRPERLSGGRPIAVEQAVGERGRRGFGRRRERGIVRRKSERAQKFAKRFGCARRISRFFRHG